MLVEQEHKESEPKSSWVLLKPENAHEISEIRHKRLQWAPNQMLNHLEINVDHFETLLDRFKVNYLIELTRLNEQTKRPEVSVSGVNNNGEATVGKVTKAHKVKKSALRFNSERKLYQIAINFDELLNQSKHVSQLRGNDSISQWKLLAREIEKEIQNRLMEICEWHVIFLGLRDLFKTIGAGACSALIVSTFEALLSLIRWKFETPQADITEITVFMGIFFIAYLAHLEFVFSAGERNLPKNFFDFFVKVFYLYFWYTFLSGVAGMSMTQIEKEKLIRSVK